MGLQEEEVIYSSPGVEGTACTAPACCPSPVPSPLFTPNSLVWDALVSQRTCPDTCPEYIKPGASPPPKGSRVGGEQTRSDIQTTQGDHCQGPGTSWAGKLVCAGVRKSQLSCRASVGKAGQLRVTAAECLVFGN